MEKQQQQCLEEDGTTGASQHPFRDALRIHGKWYDVTDFAHPGGPVMLSLGKGRDATALFESHHPFTSRQKLNKLLAKYETDRPCVLLNETDQGDEFVWPQSELKGFAGGEVTQDSEPPLSDFAKDVIEQVRAYFKSESERRGVSFLQATKATPGRFLELAVLAAIFLATLPAFFRGEWWTLVATPLTYWVLGVNTFHDASHFALSRDWRLNALGTYLSFLFTSPLEWYHQHVIGHHVYTNIPRKDPDLYHNATMERHTRTLRWKPLHKHQAYTWFPIWGIGTFAMSYLKPIQMFLTDSYNRSVPKMRISKTRTVIHFAGRVLMYALCHLWPFFVFSPLKAFLFGFTPIAVFSFAFMLSSQVNHLTLPNIDKHSQDYYAHQVLTSHSFARDSYLSFLFTGGLNMQTEHHLFPCVNHCHHRSLQPIVSAVCKKHNIPYHYSPSMWVAFMKYIEHLKVLSIKPHDE